MSWTLLTLPFWKFSSLRMIIVPPSSQQTLETQGELKGILLLKSDCSGHMTHWRSRPCSNFGQANVLPNLDESNSRMHIQSVICFYYSDIDSVYYSDCSIVNGMEPNRE